MDVFFVVLPVTCCAVGYDLLSVFCGVTLHM